MELKIPIEVDFDDLKSLLDDLGKLQKYKLFEGDEMVLVDVDDVADVLVKHIKAKEAQPKMGKWIKLDAHAHLADHKCSACGQECYVPTCMGDPMYDFCPNCGARMLKEGD